MKSNFIQLLAIFGSGLLSPAAAQAQIILDGSLGRTETLMGPGYQIGAELGQQHGGNLFHSFQDFNLQSHESATFSGPNEVQNVISRVTGSNPSNIDGLIRSTIPNADFYLLNPYGILFGPHAKLDLQGGFHASTADYLKLQDGGRFDARNVNNSLLSVAPVAAFGFLTETPAPIAAQSSRLSVPATKPLSLIGGHLNLQGAFPVQFDEQNSYAMFAASLLNAASGQINLIAVGSDGELFLDNDLTITGIGGNILLNHTLIDTSGPGSGNIKVRGARLQMNDSILQANTLGDFNGGVMDIRLTESLYARNERYLVAAFASRTLLGHGNGGQIVVRVPEFTLDRTVMGLETVTAGNAGSLNLEVARLHLLEGAGLSTAQAFSAIGKGGQMTINASESVLISGFSVGTHASIGVLFTNMPTYIDNSSYSLVPGNLGGGETHITTQRLDLVGGAITSAGLDKGSAGNIIIHADNVNITEGGFISTTVMGTGLAGNILLDVKDTLFMSGQRDGVFVTPITNLEIENPQSNITSFSLSGSGGQIDLTAKTINVTEGAFINTSSLGSSENTSHINLRTDNLLLTAGGKINSSNGFYAGTGFLLGTGRGGDINIDANTVTLTGSQTGIFSDTFNQGLGGSLFVQADSVDIDQGAAMAARSFNMGDAGQISLETNHLHLSQRGTINTSATLSGGGNIILQKSNGLVHLDQSEITTSVAVGQGSGGNITIEKPQFVVLNQGQIKAQADAGHGGNIQIVTDHLLTTVDSLISASSRLGIDGQVDITSPDINISNGLLGLSNQLRPANLTFKNTCGVKSWEEFLNLSTFFVHSLAGRSWSPFDLQPSFIK